jgi:glycerophosphoryl diester phosphodiesterase/HEAT repeat protein
MKWPVLVVMFFTLTISAARAGILSRGHTAQPVQLICHRTANRDMPENTLESLALAARMGCNIVEIDIRRTLDGQLVLNHDDFLERLTSGMGTVESTSADELDLLDGGAWMGKRFAHMRIPRFDEALRVAREQGIGLYLDMKSRDMAPPVLATLEREHMLQRVVFGGEWSDVPALYPAANHDLVVWVDPGCSPGQVAALQQQGKFVVANFSANAHEMDLPAMRAAVAAGVDAINVDYPRLGADAVGRPVEARLAALARAASIGPIPMRAAAIRELSYYDGFPTQRLFTRWLRDPDQDISRAAAVALLTARPVTPARVFVDALAAPAPSARQNAAWALGMLGAAATGPLLSLLHDQDRHVIQEALLALSRCPGPVRAQAILPFLASDTPAVRAAAALALARHQPRAAAPAVSELLRRSEREAAREHERQGAIGGRKLTPQEIASIVGAYREQMKLIQSLELLRPDEALHALAAQAFRPVEDYSLVTGLVAGYQLWDRIAANASLAIQALHSTNIDVANRAEWVLVKAGPSVLPAVRAALRGGDSAATPRLIRVLAWQGDGASLPLLRERQQSDVQNKELLTWAIAKIEMMGFYP